MGVSRSATALLAALLAGSVAQGALIRAADARGLDRAPVVATATVVLGAGPLPTSVAPDPALPPPATGLEAVTPADPKAEVPVPDRPAVVAAPTVPSDPGAAAIFNRLALPAPLLARLTAKERDAIQAFYALGAFRPVWITDGAYTPAARAVAARLAAAAEDGLDAHAYPVPVLPSPAKPDDHAGIAEADLRLSAAVALYARDARGGRINLAAISRLITPVLDLPAPDAVLASLASAGASAGGLLQAYNPHSPGYLALKARLSAARGPAPREGASLKLPPGPALRLGMRDPRVPLLRARFGLESRTAGTLDAEPGEPEDYDAGVAAAVAGFQRSRGLPGNGVLNVQTVMALANADASPRATGDDAALIVNMERWRWLGTDLGSDYVLVNIPEYRLRVFRDGRQRDEARVIVGKPDSRTPLFSGLMEYAVVNPSWYVPPSILKTMLPKIASYGGKTWGGYEVVRSGGHVSLRQPPGERNALGFIKFMFPNNHAVYLHDTPNRTLFARSERALSHGCVRVDDPFRFADSVLPDAWSSERLRKLVGKGERTIRLDRKLPVHLAYFTATVDESGVYRTLPDLYDYDAPMRAALGLPGGGGPAIARALPAVRPAEPVRRAAEAAAPRPRHAARSAAPRAARAGIEPPADFGEPGLWTPRPTPVSRGWW
ncbi:murein L,D-transpeptidase [uncultured Methylobacterium sp.]|uniref:L,D-transpeptidase family protein n=1 Tax=uncultured Methylobacterium sp. TaxID=157278 RepID=UPI0035CA9931